MNKCLLCGGDLNTAGFCKVCGQYQVTETSGMAKFDRFLACMDNKITELDSEIKHLQSQKDMLSAMRIRADIFKTLPEDEECINWP